MRDAVVVTPKKLDAIVQKVLKHTSRSTCDSIFVEADGLGVEFCPSLEHEADLPSIYDVGPSVPPFRCAVATPKIGCRS